MHTILVLGGYGFFGQRIGESLAVVPDVRLIIGGRNLSKAEELIARFGLPSKQAVAIDANAPDLAQRFIDLQMPEFLFHPFGPITKNVAVIACCVFLISYEDQHNE